MEFKKSAGLAIIYDKMILLAHPTGSNWKNSFGIPKGGLEKGESNLEAAIREVGEEIGIHIKPNQIEKTEKSFTISKQKKLSKVVYYYYVKIDNLSEIGLKDTRVPKNQLQLKEIDWAGFMDYNEAIKKVTKSQIPLINALRNDGLLEKKTNLKHLKLFENYFKLKK
tara:strand:+ start:24774 stop:25274 length:501 start_codon:yes stop_codon:yes gene_type:complete